ncbi:MAG: DMT family transporter [Spirochaetes bacterium]|nr:DMT family transporter [Spirochaetota bacterium]MBU1079887.1 DMT family transporter [Spirochaetota bacterium]
MLVYIALTVVMGTIITLHMSMNAYTGILSGNMRMANVIFWSIGLVTALIAAWNQRDPEFYRKLYSVPAWLLLAGAIGAGISMFTNLAVPKIGAVNLTMLLLVGQLCASSAFSHFGILGSPREPIMWWKVTGVALAAGGAALAIYGGRIFRAA